MANLNPAAAGTVHYATDPRIRHLAEAAWRMRTGGSRADWLALGKDNPEALIAEAREWVRAAVATGLLPEPSANPEWKSAAHLAAEADPEEPGVPVHACPADGSGLTGCCQRTPFELRSDRMTEDPAAVTCKGLGTGEGA